MKIAQRLTEFPFWVLLRNPKLGILRWRKHYVDFLEVECKTFKTNISKLSFLTCAPKPRHMLAFSFLITASNLMASVLGKQVTKLNHTKIPKLLKQQTDTICLQTLENIQISCMD